MNSIIEAQLEYFTETHINEVICLDQHYQDAINWDYKMKNNVDMGVVKYWGTRASGCSISARIKYGNPYEI